MINFFKALFGTSKVENPPKPYVKIPTVEKRDSHFKATRIKIQLTFKGGKTFHTFVYPRFFQDVKFGSNPIVCPIRVIDKCISVAEEFLAQTTMYAPGTPEPFVDDTLNPNKKMVGILVKAEIVKEEPFMVPCIEFYIQHYDSTGARIDN